jgi:translin
MTTIEQLGDRIRQLLDAKNTARERALTASRQVIRFSANSIRATHRGEYDQAFDLFGRAGDLVADTKQDLGGHADLYWTGYVQDSQKEYTEARVTYALVRGEEVPSLETLGVEMPAYLNGLAEAASEMRRDVLDLIRTGNVDKAGQLLSAMDEIYGVLVTIDYPDAITGNLRRNTDMVRGVLERTRGDLTTAARQNELEGMLSALLDHLNEAPGT